MVTWVFELSVANLDFESLGYFFILFTLLLACFRPQGDMNGDTDRLPAGLKDPFALDDHQPKSNAEIPGQSISAPS